MRSDDGQMPKRKAQSETNTSIHYLTSRCPAKVQPPENRYFEQATFPMIIARHYIFGWMVIHMIHTEVQV